MAIDWAEMENVTMAIRVLDAGEPLHPEDCELMLRHLLAEVRYLKRRVRLLEDTY